MVTFHKLGKKKERKFRNEKRDEKRGEVTALHSFLWKEKGEGERGKKKITLLFSSSLKEPFPTLAEAWEKGAAHEQIGC